MFPKSVRSAESGVVSPSVILTLLPKTSISGDKVAVDVPVISKLYGFSSLSLLAIDTVALWVPLAAGS